MSDKEMKAGSYTKQDKFLESIEELLTELLQNKSLLTLTFSSKTIVLDEETPFPPQPDNERFLFSVLTGSFAVYHKPSKQNSEEEKIYRANVPNVINKDYLVKLAFGLRDFVTVEQQIDIVSNANLYDKSVNHQIHALLFIYGMLMADTRHLIGKKRELGDKLLNVINGFSEDCKEFKDAIKSIIVYKQRKNRLRADSMPFIMPKMSPVRFEDLLNTIGKGGIPKEIVKGVAVDLKAITSKLFLDINLNEFVVGRWQKEGRDELSPNIVELTDYFNQLSELPRLVLFEEDETKRKHKFQFYLDLIDELISAPPADFHSAFAIFTGLNTELRKLLSDRQRQTLLAYEQDKFSVYSRYRKIRECMEEVECCIPPVMVFTGDKTAAAENKFVKAKLEQMGTINYSLHSYQQSLYRFTRQNPEWEPTLPYCTVGEVIGNLKLAGQESRLQLYSKRALNISLCSQPMSAEDLTPRAGSMTARGTSRPPSPGSPGLSRSKSEIPIADPPIRPIRSQTISTLRRKSSKRFV